MNHPTTENPASGFPVSNIPDRKTWSAAVSPSNLAMAALVGFLCMGQATEWKILGRKGKGPKTIGEVGNAPNLLTIRQPFMPEFVRNRCALAARETTRI